MAAAPKAFARFRVDPAKVRVAIRRHAGRWLVTISAREGSAVEWIGWKQVPRSALLHALFTAERDGLDGVDLGKQWAYRHPWVRSLLNRSDDAPRP